MDPKENPREAPALPPSYDAWLDALQDLRVHLEASLKSPSATAGSAEDPLYDNVEQNPYWHLAVFFENVGWASTALPGNNSGEVNVFVQRLLDAVNKYGALWEKGQIREHIQSIQDNAPLLAVPSHVVNFKFTPPNSLTTLLERSTNSGYANLEQLRELHCVISWLVDRFEIVCKATLDVESKLESSFILLDSHEPGSSSLDAMATWVFHWLVSNLEEDLAPFAQRFLLDMHPRAQHLDIPYLGCSITTGLRSCDPDCDYARLLDTMGPEALGMFKQELARVTKIRIDELRFRAATVRLISGGLLGGTMVCSKVFYSNELLLIGRTLRELTVKFQGVEHQRRLEVLQSLCSAYNEYRASYMRACEEYAPQCGVTIIYDEQNPEYPLLESY